MSEIGKNSPFTPRPTTPQPQGDKKAPQPDQSSAPKQQQPMQQNAIGKTPTLSPEQQEQAVEQEIVAEVASLNSDAIVEEELEQPEETTTADPKEVKEGAANEGQGKTATGMRKPPVNIGKMTMNEDGQQTDVPDDSIGHLANTLLDGTPESLSEAAEVFSDIISDEEEREKEQEEEEGEEEEQDDQD